MEKLRVALIAGGWSGEREVSLKSGEAVRKALDPEKYSIKRYDPRDGLEDLVRDREKLDVAFVLLHGRYGEDGSMQGLLELLRIPYVGSGVLASAMAMNKKVAKEIYQGASLNVVDHVTLTAQEEISVDRIMGRLGTSTVVKPVSEGSSLGVEICHSKEELEEGIERAFAYDREIMVERFILGTEVTCCVLGTKSLDALPLIEIVPNPEYRFFDYQAKYTAGATKEICPARISPSHTIKAQAAAKRAHQALCCNVWSRTDMILCDEKVYVLETNTIPGMTETSLVPLAARAAGMSFAQLVDKLIILSLEEKGERRLA